jgi:transcriptional regulator
MVPPKRELLPGTLDMLILRTLTLQSMHGYGIAQHIQRLSLDKLRIEEGSLYPALQRMRQKGWIKAQWGQTPNNQRARYYTITTLGQRTALLIGGTASVVGEQSRHQGDVEAQFEETLRNMSILIAAARQHSSDAQTSLGRLREIRAYAVNDEVGRFVRRQLTARCPGAHRIEVVKASVCRPDLLLEIEGVADL